LNHFFKSTIIQLNLFQSVIASEARNLQPNDCIVNVAGGPYVGMLREVVIPSDNEESATQ